LPGPGPDRVTLLEQLALPDRPTTWIDVLMPRRTAPFLVTVAALAAGTWLLGWALSGFAPQFLMSRDWQAQPLFLAAHFITWRLFLNKYPRLYLRGCVYLRDLPEAEARRQVQRYLGFWGNVAALALALPFCIMDLLYLVGPEYLPWAVLPGRLGPGDYLLGVLFAVEWVINAYIWVLLFGFLWLTWRTLVTHSFRSPLEIVLHEGHYKPFLRMSGQGATVLALFAFANIGYDIYCQGSLADYIGLGITAVLLLFGFIAPWLQLRKNVDREFEKELNNLRQVLVDIARRRNLAAAGGLGANSGNDEQLGHTLTILRMMYLERLREELGRAEGRHIILALVAPAGTILWRFVRPMLIPLGF
jgi:hypothetical protein